VKTVRGEHRKAILPKWGGRHGSIIKGSVTKVEGVWKIVYSSLLGYSTTQRAPVMYHNWRVAILDYIEHDRHVREKQSLEQWRTRSQL
jgi:hypothetical protein